MHEPHLIFTLAYFPLAKRVGAATFALEKRNLYF